GVARQAIDGAGYFFSNIMRRAINIALQHKRAGHVRKPFEGINVDFVNAAHRRNGVFERQNHSRYNFFGSGARQTYFNVDGGRIRFGEEIDGKSAVGERPQRHKKSNQHPRENGILDARLGELHFNSRPLDWMCSWISRGLISSPAFHLYSRRLALAQQLHRAIHRTRPRQRDPRASGLRRPQTYGRVRLLFVPPDGFDARTRDCHSPRRLCKRRSGNSLRFPAGISSSPPFRWEWKLARKTQASAGHPNSRAALRPRRCANPAPPLD